MRGTPSVDFVDSPLREGAKGGDDPFRPCGPAPSKREPRIVSFLLCMTDFISTYFAALACLSWVLFVGTHFFRALLRASLFCSGVSFQ